MKKKVLPIATEKEKIEALRICMPKDTSVEDELSAYVDVIYKKYVPAQVREFIEKADVQAKNDEKKKPRRVAARKPVCGELTENEETPANDEKRVV